MLKNILLPIIFFVLTVYCHAQTITHPGNGDSLYPVIEKYHQYINPYSSLQGFGLSMVQSLVKDSGKYFLAGNFSRFTENSGSAILNDTASKTILNNRIWRINGQVNTAVPDGQGGFFIGGTFTKIGDSSRKYIAQINSHGKPTSWKPACDSFVTAIIKRNDTLFIAGMFKQFGGSARNCFAMYSASSHTLFTNGGTGIFNYMLRINTILLQKDTLIYAGEASGLAGDYNHLRKYNFRNNIFLPFLLTPVHEHRDIKDLCFSADSSLLLFHYTTVDGDAIRAVDNKTAGARYKIFTNASTLDSYYGKIYDIEIAGNKCYVGGDFARVNYTNFYRKAFFAFDVKTGELLPDNLNLNNFVSSIQHKNGKLYLSGRFTTIKGTARDLFAVVDTGSYNLGGFQLSPSDPISGITFNNNVCLITGAMNGLHSKARFGLASIDSDSHKLTDWIATYQNMDGVIRMMIRGDSIFLLTTTYNRYYACMVEFPSTLKIYSRSTGLEFGTNQLNAEHINDFLIDGNYMYVSQQSSLRRYSLPQLIKDNSWGTTWVGNPNGYEHSLNHLMADATKIYTVGDSKYFFCSSTFYPRYGYLDIYSKASGQVMNSYRFSGYDLYYDQPRFHRAVIADNKIYIQGRFTQLNGSARRNFACVNLTTGALTGWNPDIPTSNSESFNHTSPLKHYKGKIWFGAYSQYMKDSSIFNGFGGIDTATGLLTQPFKTSHWNPNVYPQYIEDFIISDSEIAFAGSFDSINNRPFKGFAVFPLNGINTNTACSNAARTFTSNITGNSYQWQMDTGSGFVNISDNANFSGTQSSAFQLLNAPTSWFGYKFRSVVNNSAYSDIFKLRFNATWTGAVNTDWSNAGNWGCGYVPDANTDVIINNGTVVVNANPTIRSLYLSPGVNFKVMPGKVFTVLD